MKGIGRGMALPRGGGNLEAAEVAELREDIGRKQVFGLILPHHRLGERFSAEIETSAASAPTDARYGRIKNHVVTPL